MDRKNMPLILMLVAGAVTCIITFIQDFSVAGKLGALLLVLVIFYFLGSILKWTLNRFDKQNELRRQEEMQQEEEAQLQAGMQQEEGKEGNTESAG